MNRKIPHDTAQQVQALGRRFLAIQADLRHQQALEGIVAETVEKMGRVDILVNNAGTIRRCDALDFSEKDWDEVMDLNLKTVFFLSQAVARQFIAQGDGGKIINIASMLSFRGRIRVPSYTASKSGVMGLTRLLANEWAQHRINVNAIAPGYMATNTQQLREDAERNRRSLSASPQDAGANRPICKVLQYFWPHAPPNTSTVTPSPSMVAGWRVKFDRIVTKSYTVTSSAYCTNILYCMHRQLSEFDHDGGRTPAFSIACAVFAQKRRADARPRAG